MLQNNLFDAVRKTITFSDPASGKQYALSKNPAVLLVRPRGWHLPEKHVSVDGESMSGSLFDFGLYLFHNADALREHGSGAYFYLPKLQSYKEAALWNDVFNYAEEKLKFARGTIKASSKLASDRELNQSCSFRSLSYSNTFLRRSKRRRFCTHSRTTSLGSTAVVGTTFSVWIIHI